MKFPEYYPYRSEAARDSYLAHYDSVLAKEWPVVSEERMVSTSYGQTFVRITGPTGAPPLVLLPGACATSLMWAPNIQALSGPCRTYAVDRIGEVGRSITIKPATRPDDLVAWLDELFDALKLDRFNLAGISYGGWLTGLYAVRFPERLNKAVLIAPGATVVNVSAKFLARMGLGAASGSIGLPSLLRWMFADLARNDPKRFEVILDRVVTATRAITPSAFLRPTVLTDAELRNLRVPTLFLVGEHETIYSADKAVRRVKRLAPQVRTEIIAGAGHDLTIVQADTVNRMIVDFLTQDAAASQASLTGTP